MSQDDKANKKGGKMGRPSTFTEEMGDEICLQVATTPKGLDHICRENTHFPCPQTIYEWRIKFPQFGANYMKAKQAQAEPLVDQMMDIADDTSKDDITRYDQEGEAYTVCNNEHVNRSRLRVETRKWYISKLAPKLYGDRVEKTTDDDTRALMEKLIDRL